jgi:NAD(P)H-dependent flavin oxidoreductase YrpB (nitropropane dioxygenase family)
MPAGPGKYDDVCTQAREAAQATGALLIILDGKHGGGFSCQGQPQQLLSLPEILRSVADEISLSISDDIENAIDQQGGQ